MAFTIVDELAVWSFEAHREVLDAYFAKRSTAKGPNAPCVFEAAVCLALAEQQRQAGQADEMRALISRALESALAMRALLDLEASLDETLPIIRREVALPPTEE